MSDRSDPFSIEGKRCFIVGGTAGIGLGVARHFLAEQAKVAIAGRRADGEELAGEIGGTFIPIDVQDDESVAQGIRAFRERIGPIDVLIVNAGTGGGGGRLNDMGEDFQRVIDVNLGGVVRCLRFGREHLARKAVVIITSSPAGQIAMPAMNSYCISKAAVDMTVRTSALEMAPEVRVVGVSPGMVQTELNDARALDNWARHLTINGTTREPSELGPLFQFLASDAARMLNGTVVAADDGMTAGINNQMVAAFRRQT